MAVPWYFKLNGQERGPLSGEQLKHLARTGRITTDSLVRRGVQGEWVPAGRVRGLFASSAESSSPDSPAGPRAENSGSAGSSQAGRPSRAAAGGSVIKRAKPLPSSRPRRDSGGAESSPRSARDASSTPAAPPSAHDTVLDHHDTTEEPPRPVAAKPPITSAPRPPAPPPTGRSDPANTMPPVPIGAPVRSVADGPDVPTGIPLTSGAPPVAGSAETPDSMLPTRSQRLLERRKKQKKPWVLIGVLGAFVLLAVLVGGIAWWTGRGGDRTLADAETDSASGSGEAAAIDPEFAPEVDPESDAADIVDDISESPDSASGKPAELVSRSANRSGNGPATVPPAVRDALSSIRSWADASRVRVRSGSMEVRVTAAWLEGVEDAKGDEAAPAHDSPQVSEEDREARGEPAADGTDTGDGGNAPDADSSEDASRRVYVQATVRNAAANNIVDYSSWNGTGILGRDAQAWLLTGEGSVLSMVSPQATAGENRRTSVSLEPGQSVDDWLVFEAPAGQVEDLRLVLPRAALGSTGYIGFELPKVMLISGNRPRGAAAENHLAEGAGEGEDGERQEERGSESSNSGFAEETAGTERPEGEPMRAAEEGSSEDAPADPGPAPGSPEAVRDEFEALKRSIEGEPDEPGGEPRPLPPGDDP